MGIRQKTPIFQGERFYFLYIKVAVERERLFKRSNEMEENAIYANGFYYDVATFFNLDQPSLTVRAQCMNPGWPSPEIGHHFTLIYASVLVPIEGVESTIQRFLILDDGL